MIREQLSAALFNNTQVDLMRELFCEKKFCSVFAKAFHLSARSVKAL